MQQIFQKFHNLVKKVAEPNPKVYPDATIRQFTWNRNITSVYIVLIFFMFSLLLFLFSNLNFPIRFTILIANLGILATLLILCRSYLWLFGLFFAIETLIYTYKAFEVFPEAPYVYVGYIHIIIACILLYSGDIKVAFLAGIVHIYLCITVLKDKLAELVREDGPELFAERLMQMTAAFFVLKIFMDIALITTLDKRTIELLRAKGSIENTLEQQKTFIFSFSHELRNPINSLLGNLQLVLQGEALSAKAAEMISIAKICGEILLHNINNVLDTGKHEIGKLEVNPVSAQVHDLFQRTWSIYSELLRRKKLKSQLRIDKNIPPVVKIDSQKMNQILLNLIGNSIKFTEKGSVTVTVKWLKCSEVNDRCFEPIPYDDTEEGLFEKEENLSTVSISHFSDSKPGFVGLSHQKRQISCHEIVYPLQESKGILKIIVKDTGCGMNKEGLEKLFRKFSQVSENVSQRQIGTGLGLFITREICNAMKGEIRAYSKPGHGSTFVVCIPTLSLPLDNAQRADSQLIINQLTHKHLKALVVDDSPFNVNLICNYFTQFGATVVSAAHNGLDAFNKYKDCRASGVELDVVTLDIDMPIMDGRTACEKIRQYERENRLRPVSIILISGNYDQDQIEEYINPERGHKADSFLRKPVSFSEFNRALYNIITH